MSSEIIEFLFPDNLEGRVDAISNVINTELKSVCLLCLDDVPCNFRELKSRVREVVGERVYLPGENSFGSYTSRVFLPVGAVAKEVILKSDGESVVVGYSLTDAGRKYALAVAAFSVDFAVKNKLSMHEVLGSTSTSCKTKSPSNAWNILKSLREGSFNSGKVSEGLGLGVDVILSHFNRLSKAGLVNFDSIGSLNDGQGVINYQWVNGKDPGDFEVPSIRKSYEGVVNCLYEMGNSDCQTISERLGKNASRVSEMLALLERQGFAVSNWKQNWKCEASLTDNGRLFLSGFVDVIEGALKDGNGLDFLSGFYDQFISSRDFRRSCGAAVNRYVGLSGHINRGNLADGQENLVSFLRKNPGSRPKELCSVLGFSDLRYYAGPLLKSGILRKERDGRNSRYYLVND